MKFSKFLFCAVFLLMKGPAWAQSAQQAQDLSTLCQIPKPANISIIPQSTDVVVDTARSRAALQAVQIDTVNPYGFENSTHTNGYMDGQVAMTPSVKLGYKTLPEYDAVCLWYDTVRVDIAVSPKIVIAAEVAQDQCQYAATLEHEMKHVQVDRMVVNKYAQSMGQKLYDGLAQRGFLVGPVRAAEAQKIADRMQETVGQLLELEYKKLDIERAESQQAVDSLEEYTRVSGLCPQ